MEKRIKISIDEIKEIIGAESFEFPKYTTQLLNLANQNAQGTRPAIVGQMTELIQEFSGKSIREWEEWYIKKYPEAVRNASERIWGMVEKLRFAIEKIDRDMVNDWVKDLVIIKTFIGLRFQEAILSRIAEMRNTSYRLADPDEESKGIDGYIGNTPVSIKPETYKSKNSLSERIQAEIIYYSKSKDGIMIEI